MMVLLALLAVGLLSLSAVSLRSSGQSQARAVAMANARMALIMAIGELQKTAGPDQAVTASSGVLGDSISHPNWTGVWRRDLENGEEIEEPDWLVSGENNPDPKQAIQGESMILVDAEKAEQKVTVAAVTVAEEAGFQGRYGWWIGDEGVKARVDVEAPDEEPENDYERVARSQSMQETNLTILDEKFDDLGNDGEMNREKLISMKTASLALDDPLLDDEYFHDLTTGGFSLPVNVVDGGMKIDLSRIFDRSRDSQKLFDAYCGATPSTDTMGGAKVQKFNVSEPRKFYFVDELTRDGSLKVGPNWGILYNYHRLWENVPTRGSRAMPLVGLHPTPEADVRSNNWAPYQEVDGGQWARDVQHQSSSVVPVVSLLQMGFRLKTEELPRTNPRLPKTYKAQLEFKPVVGIWNPYNVPIKAAPYRFDWALYPYLRFGYSRPSTSVAENAPRVWMRDKWLSAGSDPEDSANSWFQMRTAPVDLQAGEFRIFSVDEQARMGKVNTLFPRWNEKGAFVFDVVDDAGEEIHIPEGRVVWIGDLFLEDSQHEETAGKFGEFNEGASASWFTFKSDALIFNRFSDLWVPGTQSGDRVVVPEQVVSGWKPGSITTKDRRPVEELAEVHHHVATWSFGSRTSTLAENGQSLRSYVDSNLRAIAANPVWDGSGASKRGSMEGWYFISPLLGGSHPEAERGEVGDGGPAGRGLIAEGAVGDRTPQTPGGSRFQGFGGPSNTAAGGQTHVAVFDVPRTPPVSIGQLQHAQLSRYNFEPTFVLGNSYANPRIPLDAKFHEEFAGIPNFRLPDLSYLVNEEIWDRYHYTTLSSDYLRSTSTLDRSFGFEELASGRKRLPNPRMVFRPLPGDSSLDEIIEDADDRAAEAISARVAIKGGFNVNSSSVDAWKAVLSSMQDFEFPVVDKVSGTVSWEDRSPVRFSRFGHPMLADGYQDGGDGSGPEFWQGFREISEDELDELAREIVEEVRSRGPFRSFAQFVNRDLMDEDENSYKGALQDALDKTVNANLPDTVGLEAENPKGGNFSRVIEDESEAAGHAGYVLQGDILQTLAPVMTVRSDYFRIRATGEARDASGRVVASASCEAFVQRGAPYVDPVDAADVRFEDLKSEVNQRFGRKYELVSFRWITKEEL
ncbi:hypothetical protein [Haloferula sp.]|uniref:hypothetical protein n=1 Tax=Haloferula sp. TaxID=2497595 RepID=UPI00329AFAF8